MTAALAAILLAQTPASFFDSAAAAQAKLRTFSARVETSGKDQGRSAKSTITVSQTSNSLLMRIQEPAKPGFDKTDRTYRINGTQFEAYDAIANERLYRKVPSNANLAGKMTFALGGMEEAAGVLLEPARLKGLFDRLRSVSGWKASTGPGVLKLTRAGNVKGANLNTARVAIGANDRLLREVYMAGGKSELRWTFTYGAKVSYTPPKDARLVSAFTVAETPPTFGSAEARTVYESMLKRAAGLKSGTLMIRTGTETIRVSFDGRRVRQGGKNVVWMYDGSELAVHNLKVKRFYRGKAKRSDVIDIVTKLGSEIEGVTRALILRRVPFREIAAPGAKIFVGGSIKIGNVRSTILRITSPARRTSLEINGASRLPTIATVDHLDQGGKRLYGSQRSFEYLRLNQPQPPEEFRVSAPKGMSIQQLPKVQVFGGQ